MLQHPQIHANAIALTGTNFIAPHQTFMQFQVIWMGGGTQQLCLAMGANKSLYRQSDICFQAWECRPHSWAIDPTLQYLSMWYIQDPHCQCVSNTNYQVCNSCPTASYD